MYIVVRRLPHPPTTTSIRGEQTTPLCSSIIILVRNKRLAFVLLYIQYHQFNQGKAPQCVSVFISCNSEGTQYDFTIQSQSIRRKRAGHCANQLASYECCQQEQIRTSCDVTVRDGGGGGAACVNQLAADAGRAKQPYKNTAIIFGAHFGGRPE